MSGPVSKRGPVPITRTRIRALYQLSDRKQRQITPTNQLSWCRSTSWLLKAFWCIVPLALFLTLISKPRVDSIVEPNRWVDYHRLQEVELYHDVVLPNTFFGVRLPLTVGVSLAGNFSPLPLICYITKSSIHFSYFIYLKLKIIVKCWTN